MNNDESSNNQKKFIVYVVYFLAFVLFSTVALLGIISVPNVTKSRASARRKSCFANIRILQGAVEMYNMDKEESMKTLDIDLLVKTNYLKSIVPPEMDCQYFSEGNLAEDGKIYCKRHGIIPDPEEERKISEKERSEEIKGILLRKLLFFTICFIPSFIYFSYSLHSKNESYGCFALIFILMILILYNVPIIGALLI